MTNVRSQFLIESTILTDEQARAVVSDLQVQINRDFASTWGLDADLAFFSSDEHPSDAWRIGIFDNSDQAGALGYHDVTIEGLPLGEVFAKTTMDFGGHWTVTASHELLEMHADPGINLTALVP
jgi:hypothetical protein